MAVKPSFDCKRNMSKYPKLLPEEQAESMLREIAEKHGAKGILPR